MSTATATELHPTHLSGRTHFLFRRLHSLTGLVFGGYLIVHLLVNATIAQGGIVFQTQVDKIHSLPFLPFIEWTFIYIPIIFHTIYGIWITLRGEPNIAQYRYGRNVLYTLQRASAIIIVFFILFHVLSLKYGLFGTNLSFEPNRALPTVVRHFGTAWWITWIIYPVGILASCFHLANGFWAAAITWGLTISAGAQRRWGFACAGLFALTFIAGMLALVAASRMTYETATQESIIANEQHSTVH